VSVNIAIVGMGPWGNHLLELSRRIPGIEVKYICCRKSEEVKISTDASIVFSADSICEDDSIDGIIIAAQAEKHYEAALPFLKRGLAVFIEKPLAASSIDCQKIISLAQKHSSPVMVGDKYAYSTAINALKRFIGLHDVTIQSISSRWLKNARVPKEGIFIDLVYHHVYLCDYLLSRQFDSLKKYTLNYQVINKDKIPITGVVLLHYGEVICSIEATYNNHHNFFDNSMRIETDKGVFIVKDIERKVSAFLEPKLGNFSFEFREQEEASIVEELKAFAKLIVDGTPPRISIWDDFHIVQYLE
jgi:predicted dehydrogenase